MGLQPLGDEFSSEADLAFIPIGQDIPFRDWSNVVPTTAVKPDLLASINEIAGQVGVIFDAGWSVYEKIVGRTKANEQIAGETVGAEPTPIIIQKQSGFYELYTENKTSVFLIGGGLILLTMTLLVKKVR